MQIGDEIVFTNLDTKETLRVRVKAIYVYKDFKELYTHFSPLLLGYKVNEKATYEDMYFYYSKENIEKMAYVELKSLKSKFCSYEIVKYAIIIMPPR